MEQFQQKNASNVVFHGLATPKQLPMLYNLVGFTDVYAIELSPLYGWRWMFITLNVSHHYCRHQIFELTRLFLLQNLDEVTLKI